MASIWMVQSFVWGGEVGLRTARFGFFSPHSPISTVQNVFYSDTAGLEKPFGLFEIFEKIHFLDFDNLSEPTLVQPSDPFCCCLTWGCGAPSPAVTRRY